MTKEFFPASDVGGDIGLRAAQPCLLLTFCLTMLSSGAVFADSVKPKDGEENAMSEQRYIGMWVTGDGHIRHELKPGGRYEEQRGSRKAAYVGSYQITGDHIEYQDDTGFTADGDFRDDVLYHAGMILYRER